MRSYSPFSPIVAGLILIAVGQLAQRLMPLLGRMAYQAAAAGSYNPANYRLPLLGYYVVAAALIVLGVLLAVFQNKRNAER
jgi:hypothetical protein